MGDTSVIEGPAGNTRSKSQEPSESKKQAFKLPDKQDLMNKLIDEKINEYIKFKFKDDHLWEAFQDDFSHVSEEDFKSASIGSQRALRLHLRSHGVWVMWDRRVTIAKSLVQTLNEDEPTDWTREEVENSNETFNSNKIIAVMRSTPRPLEKQSQEPEPGNTIPFKPTTPYPPASLHPQSLPSQLPAKSPKNDSFLNNRLKNFDPQFSAVIPTVQDIVTGIEALQTGNKELSALARLYTSEDYKYSGTSTSYEDNLNYKFAIFGDFCKKSGVTSALLPEAFSIMLRGGALQFYLTSCQNRNMTIFQMFEAVKEHFEGEEHRENMLNEWNNTSLKKAQQQSPNKSRVQIFKEMIQKLQQIQCSLDPSFQTEAALRNRIKMACVEIPCCSMATLIPTTTIAGLINNITTAISNDELSRKDNDVEPNQPTAFFTDRRYHGIQSSRSDSGRHMNNSQGYNNRVSNSSQKQTPRRKRCFVCRKEGCWSNRHTDTERQKAQKQFNARVTNNFDSFVQEFEGEEPFDDGLEEESNALLLELADYDQDPPTTDSFLSENIPTNASEAEALHLKLCDQMIFYKITHEDPTTSYVVAGRYTSDIFKGIMIDTGAASTSTAGYNQVQAYIAAFNGKIDSLTAGAVRAHFGIGHATSIGSIDIDSPIGKIKFHVIPTDTPFLLCLQDMDRLGIYFNNISNQLVKNGSVIASVVRIYNHPFLVWEKFSDNYLTDTELRQLHRRFGHPSVNRLVRTLERAGHDDPNHRHLLERIQKFCGFCQKHSRSPGRFKFTLKNDVHFNYALVVDVMYIDNSPILHVVDEATSFQAARWLNNMTALHTWEILRLCWIDVYTGPPELIVHDAGTNFDSNEFRQNAASMSIITKSVPVEAHQSIGSVERYHGPLRRAYRIVTEELKNQPTTKEGRLQMAVKAINDTAGPDGLVPTLLVFGTFPRISNFDPPTPSITERSRVIKMAMAEVSKFYAKRKVNDALQQRNGPRTSIIQDTSIGSDVLVWKENQKSWNGPFQLLAIEGETCTVRTPHGPVRFRSTSVKPYMIEPQPKNSPPQNRTTSQCKSSNINSESQQTDLPRRNPSRHRQPPARFREIADITICINSPFHPSPSFQESRQKELNGLLERGVFKIVDKNNLPNGTRIFGSRFVDEIKYEGTNKAFEKSRLVVQAFKDLGKRSILTQAPTIQRASQRLILIISLMRPELNVYLRDITQAYTQSVTNLRREIYIRAPPEMGLNHNSILQVILPLYGIPEAGTHWFRTYYTHHTEKLKLTPSSFDPCLLHNKEATGIVGVQTDDSLIVADDEFAETENLELRRANLLAKPREKLTDQHPLNFNGLLINLINGNIKISQLSQTKKIEILRDDFSKEQYVAQRARGAYVATVSQPQATFALSVAAQTSNPTLDDARKLNKCLQWQQKSAGLKFVKLDLETLRIFAFTDSSFANNKDFSSQIGYVIVLADDKNNANLVHWQSIKCRRVTRSVLGSELYALSLGFDVASSIKSTLDQILSGIRGNKKIPLTICIDSKSLYDCLVKLGTTDEKRLMVDIMCLRQSYERREITEILWIPGDKNPADSMTKEKPCNALERLVETNKLDLTVEGWVERETTDLD